MADIFKKTAKRRRTKTTKKPPPLDPMIQDRLMASLRSDAKKIACRFELEYMAIEAEGTRVRKRYGSCFNNGLIKIRLSHARTGQPLKYSSLIDTLCHEMAHLKHFNHGRGFKELYQEILEWARDEKIYCPGRARKPAARKRALLPTSAAVKLADAPPPAPTPSFGVDDLIRFGKAVIQLPLQIGLEFAEKQLNRRKQGSRNSKKRSDHSDQQLGLL